MFKLHTNATRLVKRLALLSCVMAIGASGAGDTAIAASPTVTTPWQEIAATHPGGTHASIQWNSSDDVGIAEQILWHGTGAPVSWAPIPLSSTIRGLTLSVADTTSHTFAVAARDVEGNWSMSGQSLPFKRRIIESSNSTRAVMSTTDFWSIGTSPGYSGGSTLKTTVPGESAIHAWSTNALNVAVIGTRDPMGGSTTVRYYSQSGTLQGGAYAVSQNGSTRYRQVFHQKRYSSGVPGIVRVSSGGGGFTDVDAIVIFEYSP